MIKSLLAVIIYSIGVAVFVGYVHLIDTINRFLDPDDPDHGTNRFDYIIVGAGTAGLTVANGIPSESVLILEAGTNGVSVFDIPIVGPMLQRTAFDWSVDSVPQQYCCQALRQNRSRLPLGRGYGGSQILNNMIYVRGHPDDYKDWFREYYLYERDVEPYFNEVEQSIELSMGFGTSFSDRFIKAGRKIDKERKIGTFERPHVQQFNGKRWNVAHSYHSRGRNHTIRMNAQALRIKFENKRAVGIFYIKNEREYIVWANKGIILSAGTIHTPAILLNSGIGPIESTINHLHTLSGVGRNLQDHITVGLDLIQLNVSLDLEIWKLINPINLFNYFRYGTGPLTLGGCEAIGFINILQSVNNQPDIGFMVIPSGISSDSGVLLRHNFNIADHVWWSYFQPLTNFPGAIISILPILLHPKSRGLIRLTGQDRKGRPIIEYDPKYLSDSEDIVLLRTGIRIVEQLIDQIGMEGEIGVKINPQPFPGCESFEFRSNPYWDCYIRQLTMTAYHPVGTCKMGLATDRMAVIDPDTYRVHGLDGLYVVDGSIMPTLVSGNPNGAIAMLAQRFLNKHFET